MVVSRRKQKQVDRTFQKNRFYNVPKKIKLRRGDSAILSLKESRIELSHIGRFKRLLKRMIKKRRKKSNRRGGRGNNEKKIVRISLPKRFKRRRIWYFGKTYYYLQKKSKNSRMGKGKGSIDRKVLKLKKNFILFEFRGFSVYKVKFFLNKINKRLNFKFGFIYKKIIICSSWFQRKHYSFFYKKYLLS